MFQATMKPINLLQLCKEWYLENPSIENRNLGICNDDINLGRITMKTIELKWKALSSDGVDERQHIGQANITQVSPSSETDNPVGFVHTSKGSENGIRVNITKGCIEGLNRYIKLDLKQRDVSEIFGNFLEFDPSKSVSHIKENKMKLSLAMEQPLGPSGATCSMYYKAKNYTAKFSCKVVLEGIVPMRYGGRILQQEISEIIRDLQATHRDRDDLKALQINKKSVELKLKGVADFRWESNHGLICQDNH